MNVFVLFIVLTIIISLWIPFKRYCDYKDFVEAFYIFILTFLFSCFIFFGLYLSLEAIWTKNENSTLCHQNIVSLKDMSSTEGQFFLGSGTIEGKEYYSYYIQEGNTFKKGRALVDNTLIIEDPSQKPRIEWTETEQVVPSWLGLSLCSGIEKSEYKLIVPKNTIIKSFEIK